ncbi:unnamed protein product, partial [Hapterophycus canaliculatus]
QVTKPGDRWLGSPVMTFRQRHEGGDEQISRQMRRHFDFRLSSEEESQLGRGRGGGGGGGYDEEALRAYLVLSQVRRGLRGDVALRSLAGSMLDVSRRRETSAYKNASGYKTMDMSKARPPPPPPLSLSLHLSISPSHPISFSWWDVPNVNHFFSMVQSCTYLLAAADRHVKGRTRRMEQEGEDGSRSGSRDGGHNAKNNKGQSSRNDSSHKNKDGDSRRVEIDGDSAGDDAAVAGLPTMGGAAGTMGVLYWQLADTWQGPSWSTIEYDGSWKVSHHMVKRAFSSPLGIAGMVTKRSHGGEVGVGGDALQVETFWFECHLTSELEGGVWGSYNVS